MVDCFGIRSVPPCADCWEDGQCSMNCGPRVDPTGSAATRPVIVPQHAPSRQSKRQLPNAPSRSHSGATVGFMDVAAIANRFREEPVEVLQDLLNHMKAGEIRVKVSADVAGGLHGDSVRLVLIVSEKEQVR